MLKKIRTFVAEHISYFKIPQQIIFVDYIPRVSGKIQRKVLYKNYQDIVEKRVSIEQKLLSMWRNIFHREVNIHDNFFQLGGDSLTIMNVVSAIHNEFAIELPQEKIFTCPTIAALTDFIITQNGEKVISYSLSPAQKRLWFIEQKDNSHSAYNMCASLYLEGVLDVSTLEKSINQICKRHDTLRTTFRIEKGKLLQRVEKYRPIQLDITNVTSGPTLYTKIKEEAQLRFDLSMGPLLRAHLLRLQDDKHILLINLHHIIADGWSVKIFYKELVAFYKSLQQGIDSDVAPLPIRYKDFVLQQQDIQTASNYLSYWQQQINTSFEMNLPFDFPRPKHQTYRGKKFSSPICKKVFSALKTWSNCQQTTLFTTLLASFYTLIFRHTGQHDLIVGTPTANRDAKTQSLIGFFANTLILKTELNNNCLFTDFVKQVQETIHEARLNQNMPLEKLIEELKIDRDSSKPPLFQVMFAFQNLPEWQNPCELKHHDYEWLGDNAFEFSPELTACPLAIDSDTAKFDLTLYVLPQEQPKIVWQYNSDLFCLETIQRFNEQFLMLLEDIIDKPDQPLGKFSLSKQNQHKAKNENVLCTKEHINRIFEQQVQCTPQKIAIDYKNTSLTYDEVNKKANSLAHYLRKKGVLQQDVIAVILERSSDILIAMLAVFKIGATYLPLDPTYPQQRIDYILQDASPQWIICDNECINLSYKTIDLFRDGKQIEACNSGNLQQYVEGLAYIIYTSGSTGCPKGVLISYDSLRHYIDGMLTSLDINSEDKYLCTASISFSSSIRQLVLPVCCGATIVMASNEQRSDFSSLLELIRLQDVSIIDIVPSSWRGCIRYLESLEVTKRSILCKNSLRLVLLASEALTIDLPQRWRAIFQRDMQIMNMYGQTETTGIVAIYQVLPQVTSAKTVPIGSSITHTQIDILDSFLQPTVGVGEIYVSGPQLAQGYLNLPQQTKEKFVSLDSGNKLYRTGDLARYRNDGTIEFCGRADQQIKIRGFRCQPEEITTILLKEPNVKNAVVVPYSVKDHQKMALIVVSEDNEDHRTKWLSVLKENLPDYMIPSLVLQRKLLPLTTNGKIDLRKLKKDVLEQSFTSPKKDFYSTITSTEKLLTVIWKQVLQVNDISTHDNFFDLGGDSIVSIEIFVRSNEVGLDLQLKDIFQFPTIKDLAAAIDAKKTTTVVSSSSDKDFVWVSIDNLRLYSCEALEQAGLCSEGAAAVTDVQLESSLREQKTHNIGDIPRYAQRLKNKILNPCAEINVVSETAVSAKIDGDNAPGQWVASVAMKKAIEKAKLSGIGLVGVCRSNHFGAAGHYAWMAACENVIGLCTTNGPVILAPTGGTTPTFGNNPLAAGIPVEGYLPVVLDIAMSVAPRGKIGLHLAEGKPLSSGWILDQYGRPSTNIEDLAAGLGVPIGEHKGYGLALIMEILAGALTGAGFCSDHNKKIQKNKRELDFGHFFIAISPELFMPLTEFKTRVAQILSETKSGQRIVKDQEILIPGEMELRAREKNWHRGVPLPKLTYDNLVKYGKNNTLTTKLMPL